MKDTLLVPWRYRGPAKSGNGGWVSGALADALGDTFGRAVTVTLRQPPPLDVTMRIAPRGSADPDQDPVVGADLTFGGALVAFAEVDPAEAVEGTLDPVEAVAWEQAAAAGAAYPGHVSHPFPTCFACGTERDDGLRIFPGEVPPAHDGRTRVAASWVPDETVRAESVERDDPAPRASLAATWAALDCIGGWAGDLGERLMVLGRMTAVVDDLPVVGEPHVVTGEHRGSAGRRTSTASTLHDSDGRIVARAEHVWVAVDPARFNG